MVSVQPGYIVDTNEHRKAVVVPLKAWQRIVEDLEELDDIRAYDKARAGKQASIPLEQALREIAKRKKKA